jgi:hypothetical protein
MATCLRGGAVKEEAGGGSYLLPPPPPPPTPAPTVIAMAAEMGSECAWPRTAWAAGFHRSGAYPQGPLGGSVSGRRRVADAPDGAVAKYDG